MLSTEQVTRLELLSVVLENKRQITALEAQQLGAFIVDCAGNQSMNLLLQQQRESLIANNISPKAIEFTLDVTYHTRHWHEAAQAFDRTYMHFLKLKNNQPLDEQQKPDMVEFMKQIAVFHSMALLLPRLDPLVSLNLINKNDSLAALHEKMKMCQEIDKYLNQKAAPPMFAAHRATWQIKQFADSLHTFAKNHPDDLTNQPKPGK